ncbi:cell adhesion molecule CEACAM6-like [Desmodus rotundus]|uniref:cell adhesion molecule CEACAM6-like n=1 Tax=Desmodus rotundus TaxID=9430 RepID=UPI0039E29E21
MAFSCPFVCLSTGGGRITLQMEPFWGSADCTQQHPQRSRGPTSTASLITQSFQLFKLPQWTLSTPPSSQAPPYKVSFSTFWSLASTANISIESTYAVEGKNVLLRIHNKPPEVVGIVWYKGKGVDKNNVIAFYIMTSSFYLSGPANNAGEMITDDGSLLLRKVTKKDAGTYTVVVHLPDSKQEIGIGVLQVYERLRKPVLIANRYRVTENKDSVLLTCYTNGKYPQWLLNGMNLTLTDRKMFSIDGRRLTIYPVQREDAGVYKCKVWNPIMCVESQPLVLQVKQ